MVKNKTTDQLSAQDVGVANQTPNIRLEKLYVPEKSKETKFIDGSPDEIAGKLVDVLKNEIKVIN